MSYWVVNDRYAQSRCLVRDWDEFCEMCSACFGEDWVEPEFRERADGSIETAEGSYNGRLTWETTLVPVDAPEMTGGKGDA